MASSDHPETPPAKASTPVSIQAIPETPVIPLPPPPQLPAVSVEKFTRLRGRLDAVLVVLVVVFAFLAASSAVINSDFFRELALGRLLAQGNYHFGVDPFTYTSDGIYWVHHSWLFALMVYALYQSSALGGIAVVVSKAVVVAVLAAVLLRTSRRAGQSLWIPAACTMLAILVISPRLYLQSYYLSFLFLGLTLYLLFRPEQLRENASARSGRSSVRAWWLLPPLFVLWVNCDQWFFLGPLVVALYLAGELLQQWFPLSEEEPDEAGRNDLGWLALVLIVGVAACFLNPHHLHAFTLPPEFGLSPANDLVQQDPQFRLLFLSPLRKDYYSPYVGLSVAGVAYLPLLFLGLASFVCLFGRAPWPRVLIWLTFALLSLYNARTIPLFAVVAGPITALNWLDYAAHRLGRAPLLTPGWRRWSLAGRALTLLLGVALLITTVPGWLQAQPSQPSQSHRLSWRVPIDPSLEEAALQIKAWRDEGLLPADTHWFNMRPDIANYLVWFAPGERAFFDRDITQFPDAAHDYSAIRDSLEHVVPERDAAGEGSMADILTGKKEDWRSIFRKRGVQFWIFDHANPRKADLVSQWLLFTNPDEWKKCYLRGHIAIFAWKDLSAKKVSDPVPGLELDLKRLAFGPQADQAPPREPEVVDPKSEWWEVWWEPNPPTSLDKDTAALQEVCFLFAQPRFLRNHAHAWHAAVAASAITTSLSTGPIPNSLLALSWSCTYGDLFPEGAFQPIRQPLPPEGEALRAQMLYVNAQDAGPPESLYLGIRAARRALLTNPQDPQTYLLLGHAYARLAERTQERFLRGAVPRLAEIRRTQMVAAFQNCLRFHPKPMNAADAHEALSNTFQQLGYVDVSAHHLREGLNSLKEAGPTRGATPAQFVKMIEGLTEQLKHRDEEVTRRRDNYEVKAVNKSALEKIHLALERGLAQTALNTVEESSSSFSDAKDLAIVGAMIRLFLDLGRLDQARDLLQPDPDMADKPVSPQYLDYHIRLAAAQGDYEKADRLLADALNDAWKPPPGQQQIHDPRRGIAELVGRVLLTEVRLFGEPDERPPGGAARIPWLPNNPAIIFQNPQLGQPSSDFWVRRWRTDAIEHGVGLQQQRAEWYLTRGWLALEAGRCIEARNYFQAVADSVVPGRRWIPEVNKLNALLDPREVQLLQQLDRGQSISQVFAQHYKKWLDAYQR